MAEEGIEKKSSFNERGKFLARSTLLLVVATIISRLLGMVREIMVAKLYGATGLTDSFFFAYNIPELIRTLLISGALSSVFIPIFAEFRDKKGIEEAKRMSGQMFGFIFFLSLGIAVIGIIIAPLIVSLAQFIGMGKVDADIFKLTVELARLVFPILIFIALSGLCQGIFNSMNNFKTPAFAPYLFNLIIIGILLTEDLFSTEARITVAAVAYVAGGAAQLLYQMPRLIKDGIKLDFKINFKNPVYSRLLVLAPAAMLGYATVVINSFVDKSIAYALAPVSLSALTYGFRVEQLPFSVFGVSISTALFPTISKYLTEGKMEEFKRFTAAGVRILVFTVAPAMVILLALTQPIIFLLFERGAFDAKATNAVSEALFYYSLGLIPASLLLLISRVFFASKDMKTPLKAGLVMVFLNLVLDLYFSQQWGLGWGFQGIALVTSLVAFLNLGILVFILDRRYGDFIRMFFNRHVVKVFIASVLQFVFAKWMWWKLIEEYFGREAGETPLPHEALISLFLTITLSSGFYLVVMFILRSNEISMIKEYLLKRTTRQNSD